MRLTLRILTSPRIWLQLHPYSKEVDDALLFAAQHYKFEHQFYQDGELDQYHAKLGPLTVWVENFPYSCFYLTKSFNTLPALRRPSRRTILKLADKFEKDTGIRLKYVP